MKHPLRMLIILLVGFSIVSCDDSVNVNFPEIDFISPSEYGDYNYRDTVFIKALISSESKLGEYKLKLEQNYSAAEPIMEYTVPINDTHIEIDTFWVNTFKVYSEYRIDITVDVAKSDTRVMKSRTFFTDWY